MTRKPFRDDRSIHRAMLPGIFCALLSVAAEARHRQLHQGTSGAESINSARVDASGSVSKIPVTTSPAVQQRVSQIVMVGTTPAVVDGASRRTSRRSSTGVASSHRARRYRETFASFPFPVARPRWCGLPWTVRVATKSFHRSARRAASGRPRLSCEPSLLAPLSMRRLCRRRTPVDLHSPSGRSAPACRLTRPLCRRPWWTSSYDPASAAWSAPSQVASGAFYFRPDVASTGNSTWIAVWLSGDASVRTSVLSKRFVNGAWDSAASRIDTGQESQLQSVDVAARNSRAYVVWSGQTADASLASLRASSFNASSGTWAAPSLIGAASGYPVSVHLQTDGLRGGGCGVDDELSVTISELLVATAESSDALLDESVPELLHAMRQRMEMDVVFVSEFVDGRRMFRYVDAGPGAPDVKPCASNPAEESVCKRIVEGRVPELVHDLSALPAKDLPEMPFPHRVEGSPRRPRQAAPVRDAGGAQGRTRLQRTAAGLTSRRPGTRPRGVRISVEGARSRAAATGRDAARSADSWRSSGRCP